MNNYVRLGLVADYHAYRATNGVSQGVNSPFTSVWKNLVSDVNGTLTNFGQTTSSGWSGTNTSSDPSALVFDGTNDYVLLGSTGINNYTNPYTIEAWYYLSSSAITNATISHIVGNGNGGSGHINYFQTYIRYYGGAGNQVFYFGLGKAQSWSFDITASSQHTTPGWYHIVATFSGSATGVATLYINGQQVGTQTQTGLAAPTAWDTWTIGATKIANATISGYANGKVCLARLYNRALTVQEVVQNYNAGVVWTTSNITCRLESDSATVGLWHFTEGAGTTVKDRSGMVTPRDGTLVNFPANPWVTNTPFGAGLLFDGVDDKVSASASNLPTGTSARTIEIVFRYVAFPLAYGSLFFYGSAALNQAISVNYNKSTGKLYVSQWGSSLDIGTMVAGKDYYVAITIDASGNYKAYLDGDYIGGKAMTTNTPAGTTLYLGTEPGSETIASANCILSCVRVSNAVRSAAEIKNNWLRKPQIIL